MLLTLYKLLLSVCPTGMNQINATSALLFSSLQALFVELLRHSMHVYRSVCDAAVKGIGGVCKRFPCLALPALPYLLAALAKLPLPDQAALEASFGAASAADGAPSRVASLMKAWSASYLH